jgi:primosomal protein N' (replication factor Y)
MTHRIDVLVSTPAHSRLGGTLSYLSEEPLSPGTLVRVPLGRRETLGIVWDAALQAQHPQPESALRPVRAALRTLPALPAAWRQLVSFTASYYQRSAGEVALAALPAALRELDAEQLARRLQRLGVAAAAQPVLTNGHSLTVEQAAALQQIRDQAGPFLLFGATGSGKTEVYLRSVQDVLEHDPQAQALVLVPEINLTPQLINRFAARFGSQALVALHSGLTPAQRLRSWLAAHLGQARVVLGTRMAVFAALPRLRLIVVDEEHDPSYKQQEGARYSARDLAVYRGRLEGAKVILGSATPSLESWHHSRPVAEGGRYLRLTMPARIGAADAALPLVRRVDMNHQPKGAVFAPPLLQAIAERVARGEQSLVLLNRRGYAPVLQCAECDWMSQCPHCSVYRVFHKTDRTLRCHHCGAAAPVPRACPQCGSPDIRALGQGTQKLEEHLAELLADVHRPDGGAVRIARIDADSTRHKGALEAQLAQVHEGQVDVLVGTQMLAKGHDFRRVTLVAAIDADGALFSSDFRAPERLFALLMQAGGRAGRDAALRARSEVWIQTRHPTHPLYAAIKAYDYPAFAAQQLAERAQAGLPPFSFQALVRAEARSQDVAQGFLRAAADAARDQAEALRVTLYPAVPLAVQRVAGVERAQMLLESPSRSALQRFLAGWHDTLHALRASPEGKGVIRWAVDVDPLLI